MLREQSELAGMSGVLDGLLGSERAPVEPLVVPPVELKGDRLTWSVLWEPGPDDRVANVRGMLDAFVALEDSEGVLEFALRYGPLGLCQHDLPAAHADRRRRGAELRCVPNRSEPIEIWLAFSSDARRLLQLAAMRRNEDPRLEQEIANLVLEPGLSSWEAFASYGTDLLRAKALRGTAASYDLAAVIAEVVLAGALNDWLEVSGVRPELRWQGQPTVVLAGGGTCGALGVQLLHAVTGSNNLATCSGCGGVYFREKKPQRGRNNYCVSCQNDGTAEKLRKRSQRARRRRSESV